MKIVFTGDSFTRGFGVRRGESWFSILEKNTKKTLVNKGINGDTTSGMLARFLYDIEQEKPDYIFIEGGINDFIAGSSCDIPQNNYMAMVHQAYHHGVIPVMVTVPAVCPAKISGGWLGMADYDEVCRRYEVLREFLLRMRDSFGVKCLDLYRDFSEMIKHEKDTEWYVDGIHLSSEGHGYIASKVLEYTGTLGHNLFRR